MRALPPPPATARRRARAAAAQGVPPSSLLRPPPADPPTQRKRAAPPIQPPAAGGDRFFPERRLADAHLAPQKQANRARRHGIEEALKTAELPFASNDCLGFQQRRLQWPTSIACHQPGEVAVWRISQSSGHPLKLWNSGAQRVAR